MKLYHGTDRETWEKIKLEGVLWGVRHVEGFDMARCTYLATELSEAEKYGDVVLEVDYEVGKYKDNWTCGCWQVRCYSPIEMDKIRLIRS